jgi:hypothetical protein
MFNVLRQEFHFVAINITRGCLNAEVMDVGNSRFFHECNLNCREIESPFAAFVCDKRAMILPFSSKQYRNTAL